MNASKQLVLSPKSKFDSNKLFEKIELFNADGTPHVNTVLLAERNYAWTSPGTAGRIVPAGIASAASNAIYDDPFWANPTSSLILDSSVNYSEYFNPDFGAVADHETGSVVADVCGGLYHITAQVTLEQDHAVPRDFTALRENAAKIRVGCYVDTLPAYQSWSNPQDSVIAEYHPGTTSNWQGRRINVQTTFRVPVSGENLTDNKISMYSYMYVAGLSCYFSVREAIFRYYYSS